MLIALIPIKFILRIDPITFIIGFIPLLLIRIPKVQKIEISENKNSFIEDFKIGFLTLKQIPLVLSMPVIAMFVIFY